MLQLTFACLLIALAGFGLGASGNLTPIKPPNARAASDYSINLENSMSWYEALVYCESNSKKLVALSDFWTMVELKDLLSLRDVSDRAFWTSGNNLMDIHTWQWGIDGEAIDKAGFGNWAIGQPNRDPEQRCMHMAEWTMKWRQSHCEEEKHYVICQNIN